MAGSLNHMVTDAGHFDFSNIENMGDAHEVCEECFHIIRELIDGDVSKLAPVLKKLSYPALYPSRLKKDDEE